MGINPLIRRRATKIIYLLLVIAIIFILTKTIFYPNLLRVEFNLHNEVFENIAETLILNDNPNIYLDKKDLNTSIKEDTINGMVLKSMLDDGVVQKLFAMGYQQISKHHGGVYFIKNYGLSRTKGIFYFPNGFTGIEDGLITRYKSLQIEGWYYFERR